MEEWKDVSGFENYFEISNFGRLFSKRSGKVLKQHTNKSGYNVVTSKIGGRSGKTVLFRIHRLVAEAFLPEPNEELKKWAKDSHYGIVYVNHKDTVKTNNFYKNLEWCNQSQNIIHAVKEGKLTGFIGCDSRSSKLTPDNIQYIRKNYKPYCKVNGTRALGRKFNVHHDIISRVISKKGYFNI